MSDQVFMQRALDLAKRGEFTAHPNPCVGCVLVRAGEIVGEGLHWQAGMPHAECEALAQAQARAQGATCYVTLEPCSHVGRTGPCVESLIKAKVKKVMIATLDPNPLVAGKGVAALKQAGITVEVGLLQAQAQALNIGFFSRMLRQRPFVRAKIAMSLDGRMAMASGESQWITSTESRTLGHLLRARSGAILTGCQTVKKDNCRLTVRHETLWDQLPSHIHFPQPLRVIVDSGLTVDPRAQIFQQPGKTLIAISESHAHRQQDWLAQVNNPQVAIKVLPQRAQHIDLIALMQFLSDLEINDLLVESGPQLISALLQQALIDELRIFMAPKILGASAMPLTALDLTQLHEHLPGQFAEVMPLKDDIAMVVRMNDFGRDLYANPQH